MLFYSQTLFLVWSLTGFKLPLCNSYQSEQESTSRAESQWLPLCHVPTPEAAIWSRAQKPPLTPAWSKSFPEVEGEVLSPSKSYSGMDCFLRMIRGQEGKTNTCLLQPSSPSHDTSTDIFELGYSLHTPTMQIIPLLPTFLHRPGLPF